MKKIAWLLKQLFPLTYYSEYSTNDHHKAAVWRMWFGKVLWHKNWSVA